MGIPRTRDIPCGQPASRTAASQSVGTFIAVGAVHDIASFIRIGAVGKEGCRATTGLRQRIVVYIILNRLLDKLVDIERQFALLVLHAPTVEEVFLSVDGAKLRTGKEIDDMRIVEHIIPTTCETEVGTHHLIIRFLIDTTHGQNADGQFVRSIGIAIEPGIVLAHHCIGHGTIGHSLIGVLLNLMLTRRGEIGDRSQCAQFQCAQGFPFQFALKLHAGFVEVDVVVVELVLYIKRCIVAGVVLIGIECARRVKTETEGVDVEVAFHLTIHHIDRLAQCARLSLLAIVTVGNHIERELFRHLNRGIHIGGIALHQVLTIATGIKHCADRTVEAHILRSTRDTHRMVVLNAVGEEFLKPVGITILSLSQVLIARCLTILKGKGAGGGVILISQLIHLAIDTTLRGAVGVGEVEPSLGSHLLIDTHLLLRIHNIIVAIERTLAQGVFACITDAALACLTFFRSDHNHAAHGSCTIDRGGRAVFQNIERFDIIGVQSGYGRRDKCLSIAARQVIGRDVGHIFHDDAIDDPEGL